MLKKILLAMLVLAIVAGGLVIYELRSTGLLRSPVYDEVAPTIPALQRPAVLVLSKTNGFIHKEALPAASAMLDELARENGWHLYQTENAATHNASDLARFDVVVWNNTSGDILTPAQRMAFKSWILAGGNWLGLHAAGGDPSYDWEWYVDTLLGAQFFGHTMSPQFQDANVVIVQIPRVVEEVEELEAAEGVEGEEVEGAEGSAEGAEEGGSEEEPSED